MSNETTTPTVAVKPLTTVTFRGKSYPVQTDPATKDQYADVLDDKEGSLRVWINVFTEGPKAGFRFCSVERPDLDALSNIMDNGQIADIVNRGIATRLSSKATAAFNAKAGPGVDAVQRDVFLAQVGAQDNLLVTADEAVDYRPGQRGESWSGLQKQQKEVMKLIAEASAARDGAKVNELIKQHSEIAARMHAIMLKDQQDLVALQAAFAATE